MPDPTWEDDLDELHRRRHFVEQMGGPEGIERQHRNGKLTVRERLPLLVDEGSFQQFGALRGRSTYDETGQLVHMQPDGKIEGMGRIDGRKVVITAGDFTVRGGSGESTHGGLGQELSATERALEWRLPFIRLLDAAGGSVRGFENLGRTYLPDGNSFTQWDVLMLNVAPTVSAVMGAAAGIAALQTTLAHWNVMVADTSQVFPGGPPVVKASFGHDITKDELGGAHIHTKMSGVVDNLAYLGGGRLRPDPRLPLLSAVERRRDGPPGPGGAGRRRPPGGDPGRSCPAKPRRIYNARAARPAGRRRRLVLRDRPPLRSGPGDRSGPDQRLAGRDHGQRPPPPRRGDRRDRPASRPPASCSCATPSTFPLVDFADEPGLAVGLQSEKAGIERAGARLTCVLTLSRMPWITIVVRRLYGVGGQAHHRPSGMYRRYAWPSANWGSMHIAGGTAAAYRREIESAPDPEQKKAEIEARLRAIASPFRTAEATGQDIIDPRETRAVLADFVG